MHRAHYVQQRTRAITQRLEAPPEVLFVAERFNGGLRYHLQNGWFVDHDEPVVCRRRPEHPYSLWEPSGASGATAERGSFASLPAAIEAACRLSPALLAWAK